MKKRLLSAFLAVMMVLTMAPMAFAVDTSVDSYSALVDAIDKAADGDTITLSNDIDVTQTIAVTKTLTLDLAGHTISNSQDIWDVPNADAGNWSLISVRENGDLTITGNGKLLAKENDCYAVDLQNENSSVTIENGTFDGNIHSVYVFAGTANIQGGTYSVQQKFSSTQPDQFVLNCYDANHTNGTAKISVSGGEFIKFNPENCEAEGKGTNFCAEGYTSVQNGDTYTVQPWKDVAVAQIGDTYYKSLVDAYAALPRGNGATPAEATTITLLKDSEGGGIGSDTVDKYMNYVIDFDGHTYTVGAPAVGSTGTVSQGIRVLKTSTAKFMNGTLKAANYNKLVQVVHTYGDVTFQDFTVDATEDAYAWAAVEPDAGTLKVLGDSSILARKGQYGLYAAFWHTSPYEGTTVEVDTTGKITGKLAYEFDEDYTGANKATENKGFVNIKNGNFDILSIEEIWSDVSDAVDKTVGGFAISGGYFTTNPTEYLANGYIAVTSDKSGYDYKVAQKTETGNIAVKPAVGAAEVTVSDAISKADQKKVKEAAETTSAPALSTAAADQAQQINAEKAAELKNKVTEIDKDIATLYVQTALKVEPTAYSAVEGSKKLALNITPQYRIVASTAADADHIELDGNGKNAQVVQDYQPLTIDKATEVQMILPDGFVADNVTELSVKHTKSNGVEYYTGKVELVSNAQTGIKAQILTFTTNGFSPFEISEIAAKIGDTVYPTLAEAVANVKDREIITLTKNVAADTKVTVAKTIKFSVSKDQYTFDKDNIVAGDNTTVQVAEGAGQYGYTFTYTKPSSGSSSSGKTTYKVTTSSVNNGGVNASPSSAEKGATITITLSPDKGYKLDKLTVTDGSGKTISTTKKSDTVYTFTMPASAVKVGVSYVKSDTAVTPSTGYNDVSANDWFADAVKYVSDKGMMNGIGANTFGPKQTTTRGMIVTVLYRLENEPSTTAASFTDVASGAYYTNAVAWANANGIVTGYGNGKFGPNDKITREQLAAILYRYAQYKKYDVSVGEDTNILSYTDAQSVSSYAIPAVQWACGAGVVTGKTGGKLDPKGSATRAEVAAMLMRFCENVAK